MVPRYWNRTFGGFKRQPRLTRNPEVINRKVYWYFEHKCNRRTVLNLCKTSPFTRVFGSLVNVETVSGYATSHLLSLPGPFTGFIPVDSSVEKWLLSMQDSIAEDSLSKFVKGHFVKSMWLRRDIVGSNTQPWLEYNAPRKAPTTLKNLNDDDIQLEIHGSFSRGEDIVYVNGAKVLRWNLSCVNGVVHLVEKPLVELHNSE